MKTVGGSIHLTLTFRAWDSK